MFVINEISIENDTLVVNVILIMTDKTNLIVNVPVLYPKTEDEVLAAIKFRETNERKKYDSAPILIAVKAKLDLRIGKLVE